MADVDFRSLLTSWALHLRAERKSPQTLKTYTTGVRMYLDWVSNFRTNSAFTQPQSSGQNLDRRSVSAWVASLLDNGAEPATARSRQLAVRRFSAWCFAEGETDRDDLLGLKPPKLDTKVVPSLDDDQLKALIRACSGKEFRDRRDESIVRLMAETGLRAEEVLGMTIPDTNLVSGVITVRRGKGGKGRRVTIGPLTGSAIDRYLRMRKSHRLASTTAVWLGDRGKEFGYHALRGTLRWRAQLAGLEGFTPHRLRHTMAARWLERGGSEGGLMARAGWSRRDMIDRYTRSTSERRAAEEAQRLGLDDI